MDQTIKASFVKLKSAAADEDEVLRKREISNLYVINAVPYFPPDNSVSMVTHKHVSTGFSLILQKVEWI